jgi:hypothetical protein
MLQFDAVEADADFRGILDRRVTDAQVEIPGVACGRRLRLWLWLRLITDSAVGSAASGQRERNDTCQPNTGPFH